MAALRLSDLDDTAQTVEEVLAPERVAVDRDRAWAALQRDKKAVGGEIRLVLLERLGEPVVTADVGTDRVRAALDALIA
jgi:3-dehydroquinate synthetase